MIAKFYATRRSGKLRRQGNAARVRRDFDGGRIRCAVAQLEIVVIGLQEQFDRVLNANRILRRCPKRQVLGYRERLGLGMLPLQRLDEFPGKA